MNQNGIEIDNLTVGYRHQKVAKPIISHLTTEVRAGEFTCLLGPNGAGKSTLLRTLAGFQPPLAGQIKLAGQPLQACRPADLARLVSVVLTEQPLLQGLTAREVVGLGRTPYTDFWGRLTEADRQRVADAMLQTGVAPLADRPAHTLSDGERQKLWIAKALSQDTPIILLDEPTAFLDFPGKAEVMRLLSALSHEMQKTILLSTHDIELAFRLADRLWVVEPGGVVHTGTPSALAADGTIARVFANPMLTFHPSQLAFEVRV